MARSEGGEIGLRLGRYEIIKRLAAGGMAEIFLARASGLPGFQKMVVLKRILPVLASKADFLEMFLNEARIAATLQHANLVQMYDVGVDDGNYFIAMEYLHGEDVRSIQTALGRLGQRLPIEHALHVAIGVCAGLHYAHEKIGYDGQPLQIVHRDVSPQNVIVTYDGAVKLLDFGVAKASNNLNETACGVVKGKIPYMSPEQCVGMPLDRRSDLFSVGILLFELTLGQRLYGGASEFETLKRIVEQPVPRPTQLDPSYDRRLEQIVLRALAKQRGERYQTARELQIDLEALARERGLYLSAIALQQLMERLFGHKIEAWREAGQPGRVHALASSTGEYQLELIEAGEDEAAPAPRSGSQPAPRSGSQLAPRSGSQPALRSASEQLAAAWPPPLAPQPRRRTGLAFGVGVGALAALAIPVVAHRAFSPPPGAATPGVRAAPANAPPAAPPTTMPPTAEAVTIAPRPESLATAPRPEAVASAPRPEAVATAPRRESVATAPPRRDSVATAPRPEAAATAPRPKSVATALRPTSVAGAPRSKSVATAPRSKSFATAPRPEAFATAPRPEAFAMSPRAGAVAMAPRPEAAATAPPAEAAATAPPAEAVATAPRPKSVATALRPKSVATAPPPEAFAMSPRAGAVATAPRPEAVATAPRATVTASVREDGATAHAGPTRRVRHATKRSAHAAAVRPATPSPVEDGTLLLAATPWCEVTIDGVVRGPTPLRLRLPAGAHRVRLTNSEFHVDESLDVALAPGETVRRRLDFPTR